MNKPAAALTALTVALVVLGARPVWSRTDGRICELFRVQRDQTNSSRCLGCHDGSVTTGVHVTFGTMLGTPTGGGARGTHPVEVSYPLSQMKRPAVLAPSETLNPILVLTDGRVTCSTCHDPRSPHPFHTAISMNGSALCFACHAGY